MLKPCARSTRNDSRSKRYPVSLPIPAARADGLRPRPSRTAARNRSPAAESNRTYIAEPPSQKALRRSIEPGVGPNRDSVPVAGMLVGDARCSTDAQDLTAQHDALTTFGVKANRIYVDHGCWHGRDAPQPSI